MTAANFSDVIERRYSVFMSKLRIGFMSTANIARKNWKAICHSGNSVVTAVASRDVKRSRQFIVECQAEIPFETSPTPLGSYEELIASKNVDAIYIPLPTGLRKEWVLRAAAAGKHVICEKPCAMSAADLQEMISACRKNHVQFMDGVMFMHNPRLAAIRGVLDDGKSTGQIKRITSLFSFCAYEDFLRTNIRAHSGLEPAGCLGDLGWYCIRFTLWAMNWQLPRQVHGRILSQAGTPDSPSLVPMDFSAELIFDNDTSASFFCSFLTANQQWVQISGTKGALWIPDFVHPASEDRPVFEVNHTVFQVNADGGFEAQPDAAALFQQNRNPAVAHDARLFRNFASQVFSGKLNDEWPMWALKTQQVLDACFESALKRDSLNR